MLKTQTTTHLKPSEVKRNWWLIDLKGKTLGRVATQIANILRGKDKPTYSPHLDTGDFVVAINANQIKLTGKKLDDKKYYRHSGFPGGLKQQTAKEFLTRHPDELVLKAVKGMLPKNNLAQQILTKLKVFAGGDHPHSAQQPKPREFQ